jgi:hypothetical protein
MFSPFCILAFFRHCVRITFCDIVFNDAYCAYALQISSPLHRKHLANAMNYSVGKPRDAACITFQCWYADATLSRLTLQTSSCSPIGRKSTESTPCVCVCWSISKTNASSLHGAISFHCEWRKSACLHGMLENPLSQCVLHNAVCITHEVELRYSGLRGKCFLTPQPPRPSDAVSNVMFFAAVFH